MRFKLLFLFLSVSVFAQYNIWEEVENIPFPYISDVIADKSNNIYLVYKGLLSRSSDYGDTWKVYDSGYDSFHGGLFVDNSGRMVIVNEKYFGYYDFERDSLKFIDIGDFYKRRAAIYHDNVVLYNENGYQFSTDFGESWTPKDYLSGERPFKLINNTCYLVYNDTIKAYDLLTDELILSKSVNGVQIEYLFQDDDTLYTTHINYDLIETKDQFITTELLDNRHVSFLQKNSDGELFIRNGDVFKFHSDTGEWESQNIPWSDNEWPYCNFTSNIPVYSEDGKLYKQTGNEPDIPDDVYVPLAVGNIYRYIYYAYSSWWYEEEYRVDTITTSKTVNGKEYFKFSSENSWVRYDKDSHCYYQLNEDKESLICNFTFQNYASFATQWLEGLSQLYNSTYRLGGDTLMCKKITGTANSGYASYKFAKGVGLVSHFQSYAWDNSRWSDTYEDLCDVVIIQEDGSKLIYTSNKPTVYLYQIEFDGDYIQIPFRPTHPYDTENNLFTKTAKLEYYFDFGDNVSDNFIMDLDTIVHGDNYFNIPLPEFQDSSDVTLKFKITVTDDNFLPVNGYYPQEGMAEFKVNFADTLDNYVQLNVGNKFLYEKITTNNNGEKQFEYDLREITGSSLFYGKEYYMFKNDPAYKSYDPERKRLYLCNYSKEVIGMDFMFLTGRERSLDKLDGTSRYIKILSDTTSYYGSNKFLKGYKTIGALDPDETELYAKGIGLYYELKENQTDSLIVEYKLIESKHFDESINDFIVYQHDYTPVVNSVTHQLFDYDSLKIKISATHKLDENENDIPRESFLKDIRIIYHYKKDGVTTEEDTIRTSEIVINQDTDIKLMFDSLKVAEGYNFYYYVDVWDKSINSHVKRFPEEGYMSVILTGIDGNGLTNIDYSLEYNYPNPFNPSTTISYSIKEAGSVLLEVYDILGARVATLVNEEKSPGKYEVKFNASGFSSGMYFYKITSGEFTEVKKMILMK